MSKKFFVSTPIYYASGKPHIGHAYTTIIADVLKRYKKLFGYETFMVTGTDEHGQKIEANALKNNMTPQAYVDQASEVFKDLFKLLGIDYDYFIRTTNPDHERLVQKVFTEMYDKGYIYEANWKGYYCVQCEETLTEGQIVKKDDDLYCTVGHKIVEKNEDSYFFRMSGEAEWLKKYYNDHPKFIIPEARVHELENNFLNNLTDLSISRTTITWGIPVLQNPKHVVYVWLDALFNYLSALGYGSDHDENYQKFWADKDAERLHLMSKEITRFHCIYWPVFLKSLDLNQPTTILSHGWIVTKEGKMSKSLGNVVDPIGLVNRYGRDALRYFLIKDIPTYKDGVFSEDIYVELINADLANNIGNLVSRTIGMLKKYTQQTIPAYQGIVLSDDQIIEDSIRNTIREVYDYVSSYQLEKAIISIVEMIKTANKYIEDNKPWELNKENKINELHSLLTHLAKVIEVSICLLSPVLIDGTKQMADQMNINFDTLDYNNLLNMHSLDHLKVNESTPIYARINPKEN